MSSLSPADTSSRQFGPLDSLIAQVDQTLRTLFGTPLASRPYPAAEIVETVHDAREREHAAALMRVNHSGEIAAQALYRGQAFAASAGPTRTSLMEAAAEETDHLAWCAARIHELGGRTSFMNPVWYGGSFVIGALAGLAGDRTSLGFVAETERQVVEHLEGHLRALPDDDVRSRAILQQMSVDEARHGRQAVNAGGSTLPRIIRAVMRMTARVMTRTAYWM